MKFTAQIKDVKAAAATVKPIIPRTTAIAELAGVRITASENQVTFTATNLDQTISTTIPAVVQESGSVLLNMKLLSNAAKGRGTMDIIEDGDMVELVGDSRSRVRPMNLEEWPKLVDQVLQPTTTTWSRTVTAEQLRQVVVAASDNGSRPILTGMLFTGQELVATDSYRLHTTRLPGEKFEEPALIPSVAVAHVAKVAKTGDVRISHHLVGRDDRPDFHEQYVILETGTTRLATRLVEGEFPNYRQLFPSSYPNQVDFERKALVDALTTAKQFATDCFTPVRFRFAERTATLSVVDRTAEVENETTVACRWGFGEPNEEFTLGFNPGYMLQAVAAVDDDWVSMHFVDALKPTSILPARCATMRADQAPQVALLMPVRIG